LGAAKLAEPSVLADDARALQEKVDEALAIIRERVGIDAWGKAYWNLLPQQASDPRTRNAIFRNSLELECAELFVPDLGRVADRLEALTKYLVGSQNERSNAYLSLVARSYCLDHPTELAVMCRASLDTALQDVAPDEIVKAKLGGTARERVGLEKRLDFIGSLGLVSEENLAAMIRVKKAGDQAAHLTPGMEPTSESLLQDLVSSLNAIEGLRTRLNPNQKTRD
jgi:hypothetical protein